MKTFKSLVLETSAYYGLIAIGLSLVYAVTYHLPLAELVSVEWLIGCMILYPIVWLFSAFRYSYQRLKNIYQRNGNRV